MSDIINTMFNNIDQEWLDLLLKKKSDIEKLTSIVSNLNNNTPEISNIFEWARYTKLKDIKIIIIGQDPYPEKGVAHGLAFSALNKTPHSLKNIYKCLEVNKLIKNYKATTSNLISWAEQGVLLFNTALTTECGNPGAHLNLWKNYTHIILVRILKYHINSNLIILCWGKYAQNLINTILVEHKNKFHILEWCHPSPLNGKKFLQCDHFNKCNELLALSNKPTIKWNSVEISNNMPLQIIFTDGSSGGETGNRRDKLCRGGYATLFVSGPISNKALIGNIDPKVSFATNIRTEGTAILQAFYEINKIKNPLNVFIYTDSEFWIKMIEVYMPKWSDEKFNKKENPDLTKKMWGIYSELQKTHKVEFRHIYSHNKTKLAEQLDEHSQFCFTYNEMADKLANKARKELNPGEIQWIKNLIDI